MRVVFSMEQPRFEYRSNGVSRVCQIQMDCMKELGHVTHLVIPRYPGAVAEENDILLPSRLLSEKDNYYITDPLQYLSIHPQLLEYCLEIQPDLFYLNGPYWTAMHLASIARKMGVPYIIHLHTDIRGYALARSPGIGGEIGSWAMFSLAKGIVKNASERVYPSVFYQDVFVTQSGCNKSSEVLPTVIPVFPLMTKGERGRFSLQFRSDWDLPFNEERYPLIILNGRVQREKGLDKAIYHLKSLSDRCQSGPDFHRIPYLVFVGGYGPKYKQELEDLAQSFGLKSRIRFTGEVKNPELLKINQIAWLLWFVSTTDTQGLVLVEAAACGLPVMGRKDQVFHEFFPDDFLSVDDSASNSDDWGRKTRFLLESPSLHREKAAYCQGKAKLYTDIAGYQERYMGIIERVAIC